MNIANAQTGEVYTVLVTNYADIIQNITLNQTLDATATTNCAIIPLPIELLYFKGNLNENKEVVLDWATETERNNDYFVIEKSSDANQWQLLSIIDGKGSSDVKVVYSTTDRNPHSDISYYRLKQVDFDGSYKYTKTISVDIRETKNHIINVRPNPTKDILSYDIISFGKGQIDIELISFTGEIISYENKSIEQGKNTSSMNLSGLNNGVYLLKVKFESTGETFIQKVIKN